jgi:hypothetical protein
MRGAREKRHQSAAHEQQGGKLGSGPVNPSRDRSVQCPREQETRLQRTSPGGYMHDRNSLNRAWSVSESAASAFSLRVWTNEPFPREAGFAAKCERFLDMYREA